MFQSASDGGKSAVLSYTYDLDACYPLPYPCPTPTRHQTTIAGKARAMAGKVHYDHAHMIWMPHIHYPTPTPPTPATKQWLRAKYGRRQDKCSMIMYIWFRCLLSYTLPWPQLKLPPNHDHGQSTVDCGKSFYICREWGQWWKKCGQWQRKCWQWQGKFECVNAWFSSTYHSI